MSKTITVTEEYDKDGKLIKKTTITEEDVDKPITIIPSYPYYPNWWDWKPSWITYPITTTTTTGTTSTYIYHGSDKKISGVSE